MLNCCLINWINARRKSKSDIAFPYSTKTEFSISQAQCRYGNFCNEHEWRWWESAFIYHVLLAGHYPHSVASCLQLFLLVHSSCCTVNMEVINSYQHHLPLFCLSSVAHQYCDWPSYRECSLTSCIWFCTHVLLCLQVEIIDFKSSSTHIVYYLSLVQLISSG